MSVETEADDRVPFNGAMMRWAREWRGRTLEEAAKKVNKSAQDVEAWEAEDKTPTVRQARILADYYERPFLEFFWRERPPVQMPEMVPDYRLHVDAPAPADNRELVRIQAWIETQRLNALDLYEALGERAPEVPADIRATVADNADTSAMRARAALDFPIETQLELNSRQRAELPKILRRKLEAKGILTLKATELAAHGARGLAIAVFPMPVIAFSTEAPSAQAFTLGHELGHIALRQSAISGAVSKEGGRENVRRVEEWCNRFAGAFLIPAHTLAAIRPKPAAPENAIEFEVIRRLANTFNVSPHAMTIRLMHLAYITAAFYWETMFPRFREEEKNYKGGGRPKYYGTRYVSSHGELYTHLVLEAWGAGQIDSHNAAQFMGIKNPKHLQDIRDHFGAE